MVPLISAYISLREQEKFNSRIITSLGLVKSQIHLVSMFETIQQNTDEMKVFKKQIPRIIQIALPFWRRQFYLPLTSVFENKLH